MQANREDRYGRGESESRHKTQAIITGVVALILGAAAWLLAPGDEEPAPETTPEQASQSAPAIPTVEAPRPSPGDAIAAAPDIPEATIVAGPEGESEDVGAVTASGEDPEASEPTPPAEPTVEEVDAQLRSALIDAGASEGGKLGPALGAPFLLDRGVSAIDQLARGYVPLRALNLPRPDGRFAVRREGLDHYLDPVGYDRYDPLVAAISALSPESLASAFHRFRPLLSKSYGSLGYPADAVDNALVAALDAVLTTPILEEPIALRSKGALWAYADPDIEGTSDLQKQLLRMGPANIRALQNWASRLRQELME